MYRIKDHLLSGTLKPAGSANKNQSISHPGKDVKLPTNILDDYTSLPGPLVSS